MRKEREGPLACDLRSRVSVGVCVSCLSPACRTVWACFRSQSATLYTPHSPTHVLPHAPDPPLPAPPAHTAITFPSPSSSTLALHPKPRPSSRPATPPPVTPCPLQPTPRPTKSTTHLTDRKIGIRKDGKQRRGGTSAERKLRGRSLSSQESVQRRTRQPITCEIACTSTNHSPVFGHTRYGTKGRNKDLGFST